MNNDNYSQEIINKCIRDANRWMREKTKKRRAMKTAMNNDGYKQREITNKAIARRLSKICIPEDGTWLGSAQDAFVVGFLHGIARVSTIQETRGLKAIQDAYRKHHLGDGRVGWNELGETLRDALCDVMGDKGFEDWLDGMVAEIEQGNFRKDGV